MPLIHETVEEDILKEVAHELNIPYSLARDIVVNGQSGFTKHIMESPNYDSVRWPKIGVFKLKEKHMMVKKHMQGMSAVSRKIFRQVIKNNSPFKEKE
jgi:hypothetical protein